MGLRERADQLAGSLNVAQKKRLEMARALAARPYLLLLDEVLAGLNPSEIAAMIDTVRADPGAGDHHSHDRTRHAGPHDALRPRSWSWTTAS